MRHFFLVFLTVFFFSCKDDDSCDLPGILVENSFNFSRTIDGDVVPHDESSTTVFPEIRFAEGGLISKSGIGQKIIYFENSKNGEAEKVTYLVELRTTKKVDIVGGCMHLLICRTEQESSAKVFFRVWVSENNTVDYLRWLPGGLGLSYYGENIKDLKRALSTSDASEDEITFLNKILLYASNGNE